jgi:hypothetical protein
MEISYVLAQATKITTLLHSDKMTLILFGGRNF